MARTQRKVIACIAASGLGIVLAANPSNAMPWGASLRPSFVHDVLDDHAVVAIDVSSSPDPTIAPPRPPATAHLPEAPHETLPAPPPSTAPTTPEAPPTSVANVTAGDHAQPEPTEPSEPTAPPKPTEPPKPPKPVDRPEEHRPATLSLGCEVTAGGARATVACAWSGETPEGAVRLLVLRSDGRVRLTTEDTGRRRHVDDEAPAGRSLSYVVVFVDAGGHSIAHSNSAAVTTPAAPATTPAPTTAAPQPPHTSEPPRPTEPPHPTTTAPRPSEPPHPTTTVAGEPRH